MTVRLVRVELGRRATVGVIVISGEFVCMTLEPPWLDNRRNVSCIPCGSYPLKRYTHRTKGLVWRIEGVPNRSGIMIHPGNTIEDTRGCILPGAYVSGSPDSRRLVGSVSAMQSLSARLEGSSEPSITISDLFGGSNGHVS